MLIIHDPWTIHHKTKEILDGQYIDALEKPERLNAILIAIKNDLVPTDDPNGPRYRHRHHLHKVKFDKNAAQLSKLEIFFRRCLWDTHDNDYLDHLRTCFYDQYKYLKVDAEGCVLPESFRFPPGHMSSASGADRPPKDLAARHGFVTVGI
jgi:hypothetical protein